MASNSDDVVSVFNSFNTTDPEQLRQGMKAIQQYFELNPAAVYAPEILPFIPIGLQHPNSNVRVLVIQLLMNSLKTPEAVHKFLSSGVLDAVINVPNDVSTGVATKSIELLVKISLDSQGLQALTGPSGPLVDLFKSNHNQQSELKIRLMNLATGIAAASDSGLAAIDSLGAFQTLVNFREIAKDDLLEALTLIELLHQIVETSSGVEYLSKSGIINSLNTSPELDPLLNLSLIRLYGALLAKMPPSDKQWVAFPFLSTITTCLNDPELSPDMLEAAVTASGQIGTTLSGLNLISSSNELLSGLGELVLSVNSLVRRSALHALASILEQRKTDENVLKSVYDRIASAAANSSGKPNLMFILMGFLAQPFQDLRNSSFEVIRNIAFHEWGLSTTLTHPGFLEWLLNRSTEIEKTGAEWKYEIVKAITLAHPDVEPSLVTMVKKEGYDSLITYLKQGVFYKQIQAGTLVADRSK